MSDKEKVNDLYLQWKEKATEDPDLIAELEELNSDTEILDRFYKNLEFGTGGLRGLMGVGTNRINIYTIAKASQGLSNYLNSNNIKPSVAIAYDSRIKSELFAKEAARVLAGNGIKVRIFKELMPTPTLSFAVRDLKMTAGIVITASHNPAQYNGYKVYGSDGCQITLQMANDILKEIGKLDIFKDIHKNNYEESVKNKLIQYIEEETIEHYLKSVARQSVATDLKASDKKDIAIVYTPLNGSGLRCVTTTLKNMGYTNLLQVEPQNNPDGRFPTCPYPNPEDPEALKEGLKVCKNNNADLLLATDPDCDRVGIAVRAENGYHLLNGNEVGVLLFDYICSQRLASGTMPLNPVCIKTIVTTDMVKPIAKKYGVEIKDVLTGFKFIGEQIGLLDNEDNFLFGFEESYGYLSGSYVRDKDAVNGCLLIAEMVAYYLKEGKTLVTRLNELYSEYGVYKNSLLNFKFEGQQGIFQMKKLIENLRLKPPHDFGGIKVMSLEDYLNSLEIFTDGKKQTINLPSSDVIKFKLQGGSTIVIRPSGTEPKLKVYLAVVADDLQSAKNITDILTKEIQYIVSQS